MSGMTDRAPAAVSSVISTSMYHRGPELVSVLARVHPDDVTDAYDLLEFAAACRRLKAWADGIELESAAALARHPMCNDSAAAHYGFSATRAAGQLLAARLGLAPSTGADRV